MSDWFERKQPIYLPASAGVYQDSFYFAVPWIEPDEDKKGNPIDKCVNYIVASEPIHNAKWFNATTPPDALLRFKPYYFPRRWSEESIKEYVNGKSPQLKLIDVFDEVQTQFKLYIDLQHQAEYDLAVCWNVATYYLPLFSTFPILHPHGYKECGKSHLLTFNSLIAFNGMLDLPSTSSLFRQAETATPTLCIDDFEECFGKNAEKKEDFLRLLRIGYKRGGKVSRINKDKGMSVEHFEVFLPIALANVRGMTDILASRAITLIMLKTTRSEINQHDYNLIEPIWSDLRDKLYVSTLQNWKQVRKAYADIENIGLYGRELELWRPLLAVAKCALSDERYNALLAYAKESGEHKLVDSTDNPEAKLLQVIAKLYGDAGEKAEVISNKELTDAFNLELGLVDKKELFKPKRVANMMKKYGFSRGRWAQGGGVGYSVTGKEIGEKATKYGVNLSVKPSNSSNSSKRFDENDENDEMTKNPEAKNTLKVEHHDYSGGVSC